MDTTADADTPRPANDPLYRLILEDRAVDAELMTRQLRDEGLDVVTTRVWTEAAFVAALGARLPDVILADYTLPSYDGLSALRHVARHHPNVPFIFVSGSLGEETAIDALHLGATDYVLKHRLARLGPAVRRALHEVELERQRQEAERRRVLAEEHTRRISREWEEIFQAIGHPAVIMDPDHGLVAANDATIRATGKSAESLRGMKCWEVFHGEQVTTSAPGCPMNRMTVTGRLEAGEMEVETLGGTYWVSCTPITDDGGRLQRVIHIATDITERKRAERALQASEERFKSIVDHVTDGILLVEPGTGAFAMANATMCAMLGCAVGDVRRLTIQDVSAAHDLPAVQGVVDQEREGETVVLHDMLLSRRNGTTFFADISAAPVTIQGHRLVMMNVRDVTERRALQASVTQADRLASMGMLAAGVAHEINNPLSYVLYNLETLSQELPDDDGGPDSRAELAKVAREALAGTHRIKDIARGLSSFARVDKDECSRVDLRYVIDCAASMARNEVKYRATLIKRLDPVPPVWASEGRLSQVFLDLLINAAHAIGEGYPDRNTITIETSTDDGFVVAHVTDTGSGIAPMLLDRVFEPFFTTKPAGVGSGLGLAISRDIVRGFGGDIVVTSTLGHGARFSVRVPVATTLTADRHLATRDSDAEGTPVRGRLLVVDDEEAMRGMLRRMLSRHHEVVVAASGLEAQSLLTADAEFDLILCDLMMPDMTGMDLHRWLEQRNPALSRQVIFLTGGAFTPRASEYLEAVSNPRFEKPVDTAELQRAILAQILVGRQRRGTTPERDA